MFTFRIHLSLPHVYLHAARGRPPWHAAESYAKDRGWDFVIWTEKHLEKMGINPKQIKPLKPLKPYKKKSKK